MARIAFYCNDTLENIQAMEYYRQDIEALRSLGHDVVVCNRYRDIPLKFDVLFVWWWTYALIPVAIARLFGRTAIVTGVYNFRFENPASGMDYFSRSWPQRMLISLATRLASANLFLSRKEFEAVPAHFALENAFYAPCAVAEDYFAVKDRGAERTLMLNLAWSGPDNLQRKGVWTILEAAAILKHRGKTFSLVLAGKRGDAFPTLQQRIAELGLEDYISAIGEVTHEQKLDLFARTKLYLQPSYFEGFGLATAEAMAAGCCVITTDVGEVGTVVGDAGVYVQPGDPAGIADTIEKLLADETMIDQFSARGADRMRRRFSFGKKKADFAAILADLGLQSRSNAT